MNKMLNTDKAHQAIEKNGLTQTAIAKEIGVSKEAVSQWLSQKSFPRPNKLLQLGKLLKLSFDDLVIREEEDAPKVAFRKRAGTKTKSHHVVKAQDMGRLLRDLVPYLPKHLEMPPVLKAPVCEYEYLRDVAAKVRKEIGIGPTDNVKFESLIRLFGELQAVVVPVLWGTKDRHENAIHIYLPDSGTTWVYLNLDTNIHDFKFWMSHELGHCLSPALSGDEAEDFADAFAGHLLFPDELASRAYHYLIALGSQTSQFKKIKELAKEYLISPNTIYKQVNFYAKYQSKKEIEFDKFYGMVTKFNQSYKNLSRVVFDDDQLDENGRPDAKTYIESMSEGFDTPFFSALREYLKEQEKGAGYIQTVLDMSLLDARSIHLELS